MVLILDGNSELRTCKEKKLFFLNKFHVLDTAVDVKKCRRVTLFILGGYYLVFGTDFLYKCIEFQDIFYCFEMYNKLICLNAKTNMSICLLPNFLSDDFCNLDISKAFDTTTMYKKYFPSAIIHVIDFHLEMWYNCTIQNITNKPVQIRYLTL